MSDSEASVLSTQDHSIPPFPQCRLWGTSFWGYSFSTSHFSEPEGGFSLEIRNSEDTEPTLHS